MRLRLQTKFMLVVLVAVGVVMAVGAWYIDISQQESFERQAKLRAEMVLNFSKASRQYTKKVLRPAIQDVTDDMVFEAMSSTFVTNHVMGIFKESMDEFTYRQPTLNPLNEANLADSFEKGLIEELATDSRIEMLDGYKEINGVEFYYQASPVVVEEKCMQCHSTPDVAPAGLVERYGVNSGFGWVPGETVGATLITVPTHDLRADQQAMFRIVICVFGLLIVAVVLMVRSVFSRLVSSKVERFAEVMGEVAHDPLSPMRTQTVGHDEIAQVGQAFDSVADSFNEVLVTLEDRVQERTRHLEIANKQIDEARASAELANTSKSAFLANMSHEIRTPMSAILGFSENLLLEELDEQTKRDAALTIQRNGTHLLEIINDILDMSKIESGKIQVERIDCELIGLLRDVVSLVGIKADEKGLKIHVELFGPIPRTIQTDPTRLRQVLVNLIGNAIKFTTDGSVTVQCRMVDTGSPNMEFDVIDTGVGITPENQSKLFSAFVQADDSITRCFGGTGLGLCISREFSEMMGGDIQIVESVIHKGSRFRVTIPCGNIENIAMVADPMGEYASDGHREMPGSNGPVACATTGIEGCRILMAEDGVDNQRLISFVLSRAGAEIVIVNNGQEALDKIDEVGCENIDVVLMDMQMPILDGYGATRKLRSIGVDLPIIALTAHAMAEDKQRCLDAGCDDYHTKPINRKKLVAMIASYFSLNRKTAA